MGRLPVRWKSFRNNLEMLCHPICNWLYYALVFGKQHGYGVATMSRMLKNIGLFCKRGLQKRPVFCKETCIFKHPTHRSHPIAGKGFNQAALSGFCTLPWSTLQRNSKVDKGSVQNPKNTAHYIYIQGSCRIQRHIQRHTGLCIHRKRDLYVSVYIGKETCMSLYT